MRLIKFVIVLVFCSTLFSESITYKPDKQLTIRKDREGYSQINLSESFIITEPGKPQLPSVSLRFFLEPGQKLTKVSIKNITTTLIDSNVRIKPITAPYPISYQGEINQPVENRQIYLSDTDYPEQIITHFETQYLRGHSIGIINFIPFSYNPVQKTLVFAENIEFEYSAEETDESAEVFGMNYRELMPEQVSSLQSIQKQEVLNQYPQINTQRNGDNRLVIITGQTYSNNFTTFLNFKIKQGYNPLLITTEEIYSNYTGSDNQDKIRNFIRHAYQNLGTDYVILGGDADPTTNIVPCRGFSVTAGETIDHNIPSDLYYAALDRVGDGTGPDWNIDNDTYWGEAGEADYLPEIAVGRLCADTDTEFQNALNKQMMYQENPVNADLEKALMVGENLNNDPVTWGGTYKDEIKNGGTYNGYTTAGFPARFTVSTLYDRDTNPDWAWTDLRTSMNNGLNIINHLGHSNTSYNMRFDTSFVTNDNLTSNGTNHNFFIVYSQGCYPAAFDNRNDSGNYSSTDCIVEAFTTITNGCVAFIGNSRYGWYIPGGTNSSSQYLDRQFFDALFAEGFYHIGNVNNDSKIDGASQCASDDWFRWTFYEVNLFGDPTLLIWTDNTATVAASVQHAATMLTDDMSFTVTTNKPNSLVGLSMNNSHIGSAYTNGAGVAVITIDNHPQTTGTMTVCVTAHNCAITESTVQILEYNPDITVNPAAINRTLSNQANTQVSVSLGNIGHSQSTLRYNASIIYDDERELIEKQAVAMRIKKQIAETKYKPNAEEISIMREVENHRDPVLNREGREEVTCYPISANYNTGSTTSSSKTQTSLIYGNGASADAGWMKFDISSIPQGSDITAINFNFYVNATNYPYWSVTPVTINPVTATAAQLFADISGEADAGYYCHQDESSTYSAGWHELVLGGNANTDLNSQLAAGWFAVGVYDRDSGTSFYIRMDGWNQANRPYIVVEYTPANPSLSTPTANENLLVGQNYNITWSNITYPAQIRIQYSVDGGTSWQDIIGVTNNDGNHSWTVNSFITNQGLIRLCSTDGATVYDVSDNYFRIGFLSVSPISGNVTYGNQGTLTTGLFSGNLPANTYTANISISSNDPDESPYIVPVSLQVTGGTLESPEVNISISNGSALLTWAAVQGATGYNIYRSTSADGTFTKLNSSPITQLQYTDSLSGQTKVFYQVTAQ